MAKKDPEQARDTLIRLARRALRNGRPVHLSTDADGAMRLSIDKDNLNWPMTVVYSQGGLAARLGHEEKSLAWIEEMIGIPSPAMRTIGLGAQKEARRLFQRALRNGWPTASVQLGEAQDELVLTAAPAPGSTELLTVTWETAGVPRARVHATDRLADTMSSLTMSEVNRVLGTAPHPSLRGTNDWEDPTATKNPVPTPSRPSEL